MDKVVTAIVAVVIGAALIAAYLSFTSWLIMVLWGAVAGGFGWMTIGFGQTVALVALLTIISGMFRFVVKE